MNIIRGSKHAVHYALLAVFAIVVGFPFFWMLDTSLKTLGQTSQYPPTIVPHPWHVGNYLDVLTMFHFFVFFKNSLIVACLVALGQMVTCSLAAFAFAKLRFRGRDVVFGVLLATMMIPVQVTMIPVYDVMRTLGLVNHLAALFVPAFFGGAFGTFLLRQSFLGIPAELVDAAIMDGSSSFGIYRYVALPLSKAPLATVGLLSFMNAWNDLLSPLIYLSKTSQMTLPVGLAYFINNEYYQVNWSLLMAGTVISVIPILVLFAVAQRYFVQGFTLSGIRG